MVNVVVIIDDRSISSTEYEAVFFYQISKTILIGSHTAGTIGTVSYFQLPGNIISRLGGHGFH